MDGSRQSKGPAPFFLLSYLGKVVGADLSVVPLALHVEHLVLGVDAVSHGVEGDAPRLSVRQSLGWEIMFLISDRHHRRGLVLM